ncbi:hypothetical protein [Paracoccus cavernae]
MILASLALSAAVEASPPALRAPAQGDAAGMVLAQARTPETSADAPLVSGQSGSPNSDKADGADATAVRAPAVGNPSIAMGLAGIADWSTQSPFIDVFKTSRPWIGHLPGQWGGASEEVMAAATDEHGWLTRMPEGVSHVSTLILTEMPEGMVSSAGTYRLSYQGEGEVTISGGRVIATRPGEIDFEYRPNGGNMVQIELRAIAPENPIRQISVVHERDLARFAAGQVFNPAWLARIGDMRALRFMDWMATNGSPVAHWSDRAEPQDASWAGPAGVPLEVMVKLANETGTDPWFTLPHLADPQYIEQFASYVRDQLDPKLTPWYEYSNEVWNWQFPQAQWANEQGQALWPDLGTAWVEYYAGKSVEMAQIIDKTYGPKPAQSYHKVISTQTGWLSLEEAILDAPAWRKMAVGRKLPSATFDSYAITGYFDASLGRDDKPKLVKEWLAQSLAAAESAADAAGLTRAAKDAYVAGHLYDLAGDLAIRELRDGSVSGDPAGSLKELFSTFAYHKKIADQRGLRLVMYEGGTHVVGVGPWADDEELTGFFVWLNQSEGMGQLYTELLAGWKAQGGTMFNAFVDIGRHNKHGSWGNLQHIDDSSARWDALIRFNRDTPAWWESRANGTFVTRSESE